MKDLILPILLTFLFACDGGSDDPAGPDSTSGGNGSGSHETGGSGVGGSSTSGSGGTGIGITAECNLPAAGSPGQARPSGTPGQLEILDWAGYTGAVSYTFDDANSSQIAHFDELMALGVRMTFYLQTGKSSAADDAWADAAAAGHELGNHTESHAQTGSGEDIDAATAFIESHFGVTPYTMAAPYGNSSYQPLAETRFLINRGVSNGVIAPNGSSNPFNLPCYIPPEGAAASVLSSQIDSARTAGGWRVLLVHGFTGGSDGAYQPVDIGEFTSSVEYAKALGDLWIDSVENVGAYWLAQKALSSEAPATEGDSQTWSFTLPAHFPPGKCLRVRVDGGTLSQGGQPLTWDDHGYYEIKLDAGPITLAP